VVLVGVVVGLEHIEITANGYDVTANGYDVTPNGQ
jgi:hypothetical protein